MRIYNLILACFLDLAAVAAYADVREICGEPPVVANENLKTVLTSNASLLTRLVGQAEFTRVVEAAKEDVFANYPDADRTRTNAYLLYVACGIVVDDQEISSAEKLELISQLTREILKEDVSAIDFTYYSLDFAAVRREGNSLVVDLVVENTNPHEHGIAVAFGHTTMVPSCLGTLRQSCRANVSLSDNRGNEYPLRGVTGLGLSRDQDDWTILRHGENALVTIDFGAQSSNSLADELMLRGEIVALWRINESELSDVRRRAFSISYRP